MSNILNHQVKMQSKFVNQLINPVLDKTNFPRSIIEKDKLHCIRHYESRLNKLRPCNLTQKLVYSRPAKNQQSFYQLSGEEARLLLH